MSLPNPALSWPIPAGAVALAGLYYVLFRGHVPLLHEDVIVYATAAVQWLAASLWRFGVPNSYRGDR